MRNLEYSFDNILKSYIDTGKQLTDHQINLISTNKNMVKTYLRKRVVAVNKTKGLYSDKEMELVKKYDKKSYDDYMNYISTLKELDLGMNNLTRLHLENNPITDQGLKVIEGLPHLESLNLYGTEVTASALESLKTLPSLKKVFLWQTKVTQEEAEEIQTALPNADVDAGISLAP